MAELRVSELPTAATLGDSDLLLLSQPDANSDTGYASAKTTNVALATKVAKGTDFGDLQTTSKKLIGAINELKGEVGAQDLADLDDVNVTTPATGECLQYNGTSQKWENKDILAVNETTLTEPYVYKQVPNGKYTEKLKKLIGASVVWNQLVDTNTTDVTITSGHKYIHWNGSTLTKATSDGTAISVVGGTDKIYDISAMFGNDTVATAITTAKFAELFPNYASYAYSANTIQSVSVSGHKVVGKNLLDLADDSGSETSAYYHNISTDFKLRANVTYTLSFDVTTSVTPFNMSVGVGTESGNYSLDVAVKNNNSNGRIFITFTPTQSQLSQYEYLKIRLPRYANQTTFTYSVKNIQLEIGSSPTAYEPYTEETTALDHTTLRGLFKLDANNNLYADGDIYNADGSGEVNWAEVDLGDLTYQYTNNVFYATLSERKYGSGIKMLCEKYVYGGTATNTSTYYTNAPDLSIGCAITANTIYIKDSNYTDPTILKTALSGVKLIYPLATPTTATLTPFNPLSTIEQGGTEEFVDYGVQHSTRDVAIPCGNESVYGDNRLMGEIIKYINS